MRVRTFICDKIGPPALQNALITTNLVEYLNLFTVILIFGWIWFNPLLEMASNESQTLSYY